jgi:hypothetical protein
MAWDKNVPAGSLKVNQLDDALRTQNAALETAIDAEHGFVTGGNQTGQHSFPRGTTAAREAVKGNSNSTPGRLFLVTDNRTGEYVAFAHDDVTEEWIAITPGDPVTRRNEVQDWIVTQYATALAITITPGTPDDLDYNIRGSNFFTAILVGDSILNNPTDTLGSGKMLHYTIQVTQNTPGGWVLTYDTNYLPAFGAQPEVDPAAGATSLIHITRLTNGSLVYRVEYIS